MPKLEAFVSLTTNDSYGTGALTLGKSIRNTGSSKRLALMVTSGVSHDMRERLSQVWDELINVEELDSGDAEHLAILTRPELGVTFSKLNAWRLTQYSKCVFLDADTLVLQNIDELFEREELSAAPDIGWPDCFNSGVFVYEPSLETFYKLMELARQEGSFDGGDQGLLNKYWSDWATKDIKFHLPFTFNVVPNVTYGYAPAYQRFGRDVKIVHFIGPIKPWQHRYLPEVDSVILHPGSYTSQNTAQDYIKRWWRVYTSLEKPSESTHLNLHQEDWHQLRTPPHPHLYQPFSSSHTLPGTSQRDADAYNNNYHYLVSQEDGRISTLHHSATPLDSSSSFSSLLPARSWLIPGYTHTTSPLDSLHQLDPDSTSPIYSVSSEASSSFPRTPLSHEDVHSHISLSFYSQNHLYNHISSLADTEPRTYYIDDDALPDVEETSSKHSSLDETESSRSLSFSFYLPSYHASPSFSLPFLVTSQTPTLYSTNWDYPINYNHPPPPPVSTEYDDTILTSHDYHVNTSVLLTTPDEEGETGAVLVPDSVLPHTNFPYFPPPMHTPPTLFSSISPPPGILKGSGHVPSQPVSAFHGDEGSRQRFESGDIDYRGRDSFDNIQAYIDATLNKDTTTESAAESGTSNQEN